MNNNISWMSRLLGIGLVAGMLVLALAGPADARSKDRYYRYDHSDYYGDGDSDSDSDSDHDHYGDSDSDSDSDHRYYYPREHHRDYYRGHRKPHGRVRWYRDVVIHRPYGHWYPGYAHHYHDDDAYKWLAFTSITLKILDNLNEAQQRSHEAAQVAATRAPVGEQIIWREGAASGSVTAVREGTTTSGRFCREFQQQVSIGGRSERAHGTACRKPDGSWEVVSTANR